MKTMRHTRIDTAHHHPHVLRGDRGWIWRCACGGASCRTARGASSWREAVLAALVHSALVSP